MLHFPQPEHTRRCCLATQIPERYGLQAYYANWSHIALLPQGGLRRIDVHQHYSSPAYFDLLVKHNAITVNNFRNYTPQRNIDEMDRAGVTTAMLSPTAPAVWFGDAEEAGSPAILPTRD